MELTGVLKEVLPPKSSMLPSGPGKPARLSAEAHTHFPWYQMPQAVEVRPTHYHGSSQMQGSDRVG